MSTDLERIHDEHEDEFLDGELPQPHDLPVMVALDKLFPGTHCIVSFAEHDVIGFAVDLEDFNAKATDEQARELHRLGLLYLSEYDCLGMYV